MTPDIEAVELRRQLRLLHRHRVLIAACTLLGGVVALAVSFILKQTYAADVALGARIIAVADAFDAMTRPRVFRNAVTPAEAQQGAHAFA